MQNSRGLFNFVQSALSTQKQLAKISGHVVCIYIYIYIYIYPWCIILTSLLTRSFPQFVLHLAEKRFEFFFALDI